VAAFAAVVATYSTRAAIGTASVGTVSRPMSRLTALVACAGSTAFTIRIVWTILGEVADCVRVSSELIDSVSVRRVRSRLMGDSNLGHLTGDLAVGSGADHKWCERKGREI